MNKSEKIDEDILKRYMTPDRIEKAPGGFTERIMTKIRTEEKPLFVKSNSWNNYMIPVISGTVTIILVIAAVTLSANQNDSSVYSFLKPLAETNIVFPKISFDRFANLTLPGWIIYLSLSIFFLSLLDGFLNTMFKRGRK
jgi:hypothetical protein